MNLPWAKFYWRDWQGDIRLRGCSLAARGLWMECLCIMAQSERYGRLESNGRAIDADQLARLIGEDKGTLKGLLDELTAAGVPDIDGETIISRRMVRDAARHDAAAEAGRRGGNPRLRIRSEEARSQKPEPRETHKPSLNPTLKGADAPEGFDAFWAAYPKKVGRKAALRAWEKAKDRPDTPAIIAAVKAQSVSDQWKKDGGQYIPNPATWLNQGRWADQPPTATNGGGNGVTYDN